MATLEQLTLSVQAGKLTDAQKHFYEGEHKNQAGQEHDPNAPSTVMMPEAQKQPCCPWFTWCM